MTYASHNAARFPGRDSVTLAMNTNWGVWVPQVKRALNKYHYRLEVNNNYDAELRKAIKQFKRMKDSLPGWWPRTGRLTKKVWNALEI